MQLIKAFTLSGKKPSSVFFTFAGILGALIVLYGFSQPFAQIYYVLGAFLLLSTAIYFNLLYFIALELILLAGHGAILLGSGPYTQVVLPSLLSLQLLVYYLISGELKNIFRLIGIVGIALVSIGLSLTNLWISFYGALSIAIFACYKVYEGKKPALIWAVLNFVFVLVTGFMLIFG